MDENPDWGFKKFGAGLFGAIFQRNPEGALFPKGDTGRAFRTVLCINSLAAPHLRMVERRFYLFIQNRQNSTINLSKVSK